MSRKLGPRLAWLNSLPRDRLRNLKRAEDSRLRSIDKDIEDAYRRLTNLSNAETARKRLRGVVRQLFAPITTGVHFHDDELDAPNWNVKFKEPYVSGFVVADVNADDLGRLGVLVRCQSGDIFTALIPMSRLEALADSKVVRKIALARALFPDLDFAIPYAQIDVLHLDGHLGEGVTIGVIDDGLDLEHPDFQTEETAGTNSRVRYLWDQTLPITDVDLPPPTGASLPNFFYKDVAAYGVEFDHDVINGWLRQTGTRVVGQTPGTHGTIVTGCAAGNARWFENLSTADPRLTAVNVPRRPPKGAAPNSDIIFVKRVGVAGTKVLADSSAVIDAFHYIFARADTLNQACVANLSDSDNQDGHDGRSEGERMLDDLLGSHLGRAITLSAGNSNKTSAHASQSVTPGTPFLLQLEYRTDTSSTPSLNPVNPDIVEIWYSARDRFNATVTVPIPDGAGNPTTTLDVLEPDKHVERRFGDVKVLLDSIVGVSENGDNQITLQIVPDTATGVPPPNWQVPIGVWIIELDAIAAPGGSADFHAWVDRNNRGLSAWLVGGGLDDGTCTISVPGTAELPITVAAHNRPAAITDPPMMPTWYESSGRGPTRPTTPSAPAKPDLSTVGDATYAPHPLDRPETSASFTYISEGGTSIAAPIVAGTCALIFQCHGRNLAPADVKTRLLAAHGPLGTPDDSGVGYLQAGGLCDPEPLLHHLTLSSVHEYWDDSPFRFWHPPHFELKELIDPDLLPQFDPPVPEPHVIELAVHNLGKRAVKGAAVELYWTEPTTTFAFPGAWHNTRIFTIESPSGRSRRPARLVEGNRIELPTISRGRSAVATFAWSGKDATWNGWMKGDLPCLLARIVQPGERESEKWEAIPQENRVSAYSVLTRRPEAKKPVEARFTVSGSGGHQSLHVLSRLLGGTVVLELPVRALPWRDLGWIEKHEGALAPWGDKEDSPTPATPDVLPGGRARLITGVENAQGLFVRDGQAFITLRTHGGRGDLILPEVRIARGAPAMPVVLHVEGARINDRSHSVHVFQYSRGRTIGGLSLDLSPAKE